MPKAPPPQLDIPPPPPPLSRPRDDAGRRRTHQVRDSTINCNKNIRCRHFCRSNWISNETLLGDQMTLLLVSFFTFLEAHFPLHLPSIAASLLPCFFPPPPLSILSLQGSGTHPKSPPRTAHLHHPLQNLINSVASAYPEGEKEAFARKGFPGKPGYGE